MAPKVWTVEVTHPAQTPNGESPVRRNVASQFGLTETPHPSIRTIYDLTQFNARRWGDAKAFGTRKIIKIHQEKTTVTKIINGTAKPVEKKWMYWELGPFSYRSYKQVAQEALDIGAGLVKLGLLKGDKLAIYADTSYVFNCLYANLVHTGNSRPMVVPFLHFINYSLRLAINHNSHSLRNSWRRRSHTFSKGDRSQSYFP
jgi:hypothetical protein